MSKFNIGDIVQLEIKNGGIVIGILSTYGTTKTENGSEEFYTVTLTAKISLTFLESETLNIKNLTEVVNRG